MRRQPIQSLLFLLGGLLSGIVAVWSIGYSPFGVRPQVVDGYVTHVDHEGTAVAVSDSPDGDLLGGYSLSEAAWFDADTEAWHTSLLPGDEPGCLDPDEAGSRIQLGVAVSRPVLGAPGGHGAVWFRCIDHEPNA